MHEYLCSEEFKENLIEAIEDMEVDEDEMNILHLMESTRQSIIKEAAQMAEDYDDVNANQICEYMSANPEFRNELIKSAAAEVFGYTDWDDEDEDDDEFCDY